MNVQGSNLDPNYARGQPGAGLVFGSPAQASSPARGAPTSTDSSMGRGSSWLWTRRATFPTSSPSSSDSPGCGRSRRQSCSCSCLPRGTLCGRGSHGRRCFPSRAISSRSSTRNARSATQRASSTWTCVPINSYDELVRVSSALQAAFERVLPEATRALVPVEARPRSISREPAHRGREEADRALDPGGETELSRIPLHRIHDAPLPARACTAPTGPPRPSRGRSRLRRTCSRR